MVIKYFLIVKEVIMKHKLSKCLTFFLMFLLIGLSIVKLSKTVQADSVTGYNLGTNIIHERSGLELSDDV